ncbi:exopolysaccharide biosynthesis protein [Arenimonas donghaensis]|uniref:exopolysaccharide biosynthesis protein n=1 Tax=Arenimonas donghaensis TaxID=375061 RepID=UPI0009FEE9CE|nr:exopolysaccharide biosynthesis protein [Arenimonas donghaensis]
MSSAASNAKRDTAPSDEKTLQGLLRRVRRSTDGNGTHVSLGDVLEALGPRTYAPLFVVLGLLIVSPVGDIPGASAVLGLVVALIATQFLLLRRTPWLPRWALDRSVRSELVERSLGWLEKPSRFVDRHLHPRLRLLTGRIGRYVIAACCLFAALLLVPLEFLPGASTVIGSALVAFGIALATHDGLAALVAFGLTGAAIGLIVWQVI